MTILCGLVSLAPVRSLSRTAFPINRLIAKAASTSAARCLSSSVAEEKLQKIPHKFVSFPFKYHEELDITIEDLSNLGLGIGRKTLEDGSQWVVMVPLVLPGEEVKVRIYKNFASYSDADLVSVLKESPDRVVPLCKYFSTCGGCQYQHMNISAQRQWKKAQVESGLRRIGGFSDLLVNDVVGTSDHLFGYRSKLTPHYDKPLSSSNGTGPVPIGFLKRGSKTVVDVDDCVIASDNIRKAYAITCTALRAPPSTSSQKKKAPKFGASLLFREGDGGHVVTDHRQNITQTVEGVAFRYRASEFFQNNPHILGAMVRHVVEQAAAPHSTEQHAADRDNSSSNSSSSCSYLIDAYCGSGLFSLVAASRFRGVYGVELSKLAVDAATENARCNKIINAQFLCGQSEAIFAKVWHLPRDDTVMILDPPRKGCDEPFLRQLFEFGPRRVVYVSCDPATQARDAKSIVAAGYAVTDVRPFDLFPQTRHIENVMTFERRT